MFLIVNFTSLVANATGRRTKKIFFSTPAPPEASVYNVPNSSNKKSAMIKIIGTFFLIIENFVGQFPSKAQFNKYSMIAVWQIPTEIGSATIAIPSVTIAA